MANEAIPVRLFGSPPGEPVSYTCAAGTHISKGTLLVLSDANTVAASGAAGGEFAGIAAMDKDATDPSTRISAYTKGDFDLVSVAGAANLPVVGNWVEISGANLIRDVATPTLLSGGGIVVGRALETGSASEVITVRLGR